MKISSVIYLLDAMLAADQQTSRPIVPRFAIPRRMTTGIGSIMRNTEDDHDLAN